jgi:outer membrane protein TolC
MFARNLIKRSLVAGLATGAASLPAAAQARPNESPVAPVVSAAVNAPSIQQQLAQLHANIEQRFAADGGWPSVGSSVGSSVPSTATSQGGFQWGDAGIGAAGMIVLLGTGAGAAGAMRRRRAHRPVVG